MTSTDPADGRTADLTCSAKGCQATAAAEIRWNNPKIHTPDRRKSWLACPDHVAHLTSFLSSRGFWRETVDLGRRPDA
ncbi:MAG: acetone carboxylase [Aeromicrobium sp.]|uniref:acetone carboxylase n=1 Tax=Aeromicrobium sp. TaxID=1871063 RepID=UPI0039E5588C